MSFNRGLRCFNIHVDVDVEKGSGDGADVVRARVGFSRTRSGMEIGGGKEGPAGPGATEPDMEEPEQEDSVSSSSLASEQATSLSSGERLEPWAAGRE
jgi:hypothetical protein